MYRLYQPYIDALTPPVDLHCEHNDVRNTVVSMQTECVSVCFAGMGAEERHINKSGSYFLFFLRNVYIFI